MVRAIVFDGDDTLWETERLYDDARDRARRIVESTGLNGSSWEELEREIDVTNVELLGHSAARFPASCMEAYDVLSGRAGRDADPQVRTAVYAAAKTAFQYPARLVPHAWETLRTLAGRGIRLALLTKGDLAVQRRRIEESGLASLFDVIEIVEQKTPETITALLATLQTPAASALTVGNSVRSDVLPSLAAGVQPVWIDAHVWEYERQHEPLQDPRVIRMERLVELLEVAVRDAA